MQVELMAPEIINTRRKDTRKVDLLPAYKGSERMYSKKYVGTKEIEMTMKYDAVVYINIAILLIHYY
jgi:hypothetical protein